MKRRMRMTLAITIAVLLSVFAIAEEIADAAPEADGLGQEAADIELSDADAFEMGPMDGDALVLEDLNLWDFPTLDSAEFVVAYRFVVNGETYAVQEAHDGEMIRRPEDPAAPEGTVFAGWRLEDGSRLFADGQEDSVVAHADAPYSEVIVQAEFVGVPAGEEIPDEDEMPVEEEAPVEEGASAGEDAPDEEEATPEEASGEDKATPEEGTSVEDEASPEEEAPIEEDTPAEEENPVGDEVPAEDEGLAGEATPAAEPPMPNALVYTGEAQPLVSAAGDWRYSLDGESFTDAIPTAVDAGEYTVYYRGADDAEAQSLTVAIAKADVTFTPPVPASGEE